MDASQASSSQGRTTSGSTRPGHGSRGTNPDKQISQIEKSVTHLLVATKQLLETLTQWSRGNAQEEEVSDVYVRLGYEFNLACRAFNSIGVETNDLGPVPDLLRSILEDTLSQPASPQALDNYLPRIRDIIINLLHGLKRKQSKLRSRPVKDSSSRPPGAPPRQTSVTSVQSDGSNFAAALEGASTPAPVRSDSRLESLRFADDSQPAADTPRTSSLNRSSVNRPSQRNQSRSTPVPEPTPSITIPGMQDAPVIQEMPAVLTPAESEHSLPSLEVPFPYAPPPPPKQDALTALQRGPDLERRASRRFSAYQISKHLGASPNGVPVIPPAQNSPIPNRGREVKESLTAVRSRTSFQSKRSAPRLQEISPSRTDTAQAPQRISEERDEPTKTINEVPKIEPPKDANESYSPTIKTPEEYVASAVSQPMVGPTLNGPLSPPGEFETRNAPRFETQLGIEEPTRKSSIDAQREARINATPSPTINTNFESSPQGKELTLFLQYKSKIKKFVLAEGFEGLSMARLQLAFIEKFAWNTHNNGVDLPEIYVQDPVSGVRHELEDMVDVRDRSVLVLNVEVLDEVKKHFDESIGGLKSTLEGVRSLLDGQGSLMQRFSDRQLETSKEMARLSTVPAARPTPSRTQTSETSPTGIPASSEASMLELQNLRRDIAVLRQTYSTMSKDFTATMSEIKVKAAHVKEAAAAAIAPSYEGDAGRSHVNKGKKSLSVDSESLVNRVDDLTDVVEDLRKDVVTRGVRPLPRQLEDISKEITATSRQLNKVKDFMKREKPVWTKIWEKELDQVCTERDDLTQQEELMSDLDGDLQDLTGVFKLVEEAMKQQTLQAGASAGGRNASKQFDFDTSVDPRAAKDGVLGEVRALKPNHEGRLEAIERAEKVRQRELQTRTGGEFQQEVKEFVEEGKLRKTGGMDEVERQRKIRDERAMKENWERQQAREAERERKRQEEAAAKAAAAANEASVADVQDDGANDAKDDLTKLTSTVGDAINDGSSYEASLADRLSTEHVHEATTVPQDRYSEIGRLSPQQLPEPLNGLTSKRPESGPPQLPAINMTDEGHDASEEVKGSAPEVTKTRSKEGSWWEPALF